MKDGEPTCVCSQFFSGPFCQTYICSEYCLNDGVCIPSVDEEGSEHLQCDCQEGFSGPRCGVSEEDCRNSCYNNASCIFDHLTSSLRCVCSGPFHGSACELCQGLQCGPGYCELDPVTHLPHCVCPLGLSSPSCAAATTCQGFKCRHNSTCHLVGGQPECLCPDTMYHGRQCEFDKCLTKYCRHGGHGYRDFTTGKCKCSCPSQYFGPKCESLLRELNICEGLENCANGGSCVDLGHQKVCSCSPQYTGPFCNVRLVSEPNKTLRANRLSDY